MHKVSFLLVTIPIYIISLLPLRVHYFLSSFLGFVIFKIFNYRHDVVTINIARAFPGLRYNAIKEISGKFYRNFTEIIAESVKMISLSAGRLKKMGHIENPELLKTFFDKGVPVIIVGGHAGNWELSTCLYRFKGGDEIGYSENQLCIVYKQQHSMLSDNIIKWVRTRNNEIRLIESGSAARTILKNKENPACYFLFADQAPLPGSKFQVNFLSQETLMINGPEIISKAAGMPVIYMEMVREKRGRYIIRFHKITDNSALCDNGYVTNSFASLLEKSISENPDNWLWSHKRWKRGIEDNKLHKKEN